eukprot:UN18461
MTGSIKLGRMIKGRKNLKEVITLPSARRKYISIMHQHDNLLEYYREFKVKEVMYWETFGMISEDLIKSQLKDLDLENSLEQKYSSLSGGQKIRVRLAVILLRGKPILFLDEVP